MLEILRSSANTWVAKLLLGLVALSFVWWGANSRSSSGPSGNLATIGSETISVADFQRAYENELLQISQRARRRITAEDGRAFGIDRRVLSRLIGGAALDTEARSLNLALSDQTVAANLMNDPNFKGLDGKFDRGGFDQFLRSSGLAESKFIALKRKEDERNLLTGALVASVVAPQPIVSAMHAWNGETRVIDFVTIDPDKAVTVPEPDAAKLKETYEQNKVQFTAPEYRKLQMLLLSIDDIKTRMPVTDSEIANSYDLTKENYATPEVRRVQQIAFKDKAAAEAAKKEIDGGKNFMTVAKDAGYSEKDVDLGLVQKKSLADRKIADAAFALEKDKVSDVIEGRFATVLLRTPEITAGKQPTLDDLKDTIKDKLARDKAKDELQKLRDSADDLRNAGKSNKEIAEALKLKLVEVPEADIDGKTSKGAPALDLPDAAALISQGFNPKGGNTDEPIDLAAGGYGWVATQGTTPPRLKPYDEVSAEVKDLAIANERKRLIQELAAKLVERANKGEDFDAIAKDAASSKSTTPAITRTTTPQGLTEGAVTQAFALPLGRAGSGDSVGSKSRTVFRIAEIKPAPEASKDETAKLSTDVTAALQSDLLDAYVTALQDNVGVKIDDNLFRQLSGTTQAQ